MSSFSVVMATGIVSLATWRMTPGVAPGNGFGVVLVGFNIACYVGCIALLFVRGVLFGRHARRELADHRRLFGVFTFTAATSVLGLEMHAIADATTPAVGLGCVAAIGWFLTTYGVFITLIIKPHKPRLASSVDGGWMLAVVATQSVCILGAVLAADPAADPAPLPQGLAFVFVSLWCSGIVIYTLVAPMVFQRLCFGGMNRRRMVSSYWICMGALAISAVAGFHLIDLVGDSGGTRRLAPFVTGLALFCWAAATWWIPLLFGLAIWRHALSSPGEIPSKPGMAAVFPLGMYAVATQMAAVAFDQRWLSRVGDGVTITAIFAWCWVSACTLRGTFAATSRDVGR